MTVAVLMIFKVFNKFILLVVYKLFSAVFLSLLTCSNQNKTGWAFHVGEVTMHRALHAGTKDLQSFYGPSSRLCILKWRSGATPWGWIFNNSSLLLSFLLNQCVIINTCIDNMYMALFLFACFKRRVHTTLNHQHGLLC